MDMIKQLLNGGKPKDLSVASDDLLPIAAPRPREDTLTIDSPIHEVQTSQPLEEIPDNVPMVSPEMRGSRFFKSLASRHPEAVDHMMDWI